MEKLDIRKLSLEQITELIQSMGELAFRAKQIYSWIWQKSARSIDEMTNLSKALREETERRLRDQVYQNRYCPILR